MRYFTILFLLIQATAFAQLANPSQIQRGQRGYVPPTRGIEAREPVKPDANALALERAELYASELGLDAFTKEVVRTEAEKYYSSKLDIQFDPNIKYDEKQAKISTLDKSFEQSLGQFLSKDQVEKIMFMEQFGKGSKKADRKERRKRKKKEKKSKS